MIDKGISYDIPQLAKPKGDGSKRQGYRGEAAAASMLHLVEMLVGQTQVQPVEGEMDQRQVVVEIIIENSTQLKEL